MSNDSTNKRFYRVTQNAEPVAIVRASSARSAVEAVAFQGGNREPVTQLSADGFVRNAPSDYPGFFADDHTVDTWSAVEISLVEGE